VTPRAQIAGGVVLAGVGALWELANLRRGAWPTGLTWGLVVVGIGLIAAGLGRRRSRGWRVAGAVLVLSVLALLALWASG
jgi:hypothetical protein